VQLEESTRRLHELVSINRKLDADCCQLITEKRALEMRMDAGEDAASLDDNSYLDAKVEQTVLINTDTVCRDHLGYDVMLKLSFVIL